MDPELKQNLTSHEAWLRGLFLVLFFVLLQIAKLVAGVVVLLQFLFTVVSGETNDNLRIFGASLSRYVFDMMRYVTYNSDDKPFPFRPWPSAEAEGVGEYREITPEDDSVDRG